MKINDQELNEKIFENDIKFESDVAKIGCLIFLGLFAEDFVTRFFFYRHTFLPLLVLFQAGFYALYLHAGWLNMKFIARSESFANRKYKVIQSIKVISIVALISTMYHSKFFCFFAFLPIMLISIYGGFKNSIRYIVLGFLTQAFLQTILSYWPGDPYFPGFFSDKAVLYGLTLFQYVLFTGICYICGIIHNEYLKSQQENKTLIDRLGDKYVQLELAKKEVQNHFDKLQETNDQLEKTNSKLASSVAEFYTLQQISQAITSIFDMNELLKFVNDVIIGVMGAYHSTIALCYGPQNRLKVQVSSIYDKKDLAIVSDYINSDVLLPSIHEGNSMIDNDVTTDEYPFTKGRNIQSLICVPLLVKGKTVGIVLIEHSIKDAFDNDNVRLLEIITQQVSIAIENARLYQQMHDLATYDGLTGAFNRLYFEDMLEEKYKAAKANGYDLSMIIFDIDYFKQFNDTYGHPFGDLVLKSISSYIMENLRKEDVFARYGGEEFVVLMPHTTLEQAREKADDLRRGISNLTVTDCVISVSVTVSVGVSSFPSSAGRPTDLIKTSDDALYEAKREGRNQVRLARVQAS